MKHRLNTDLKDGMRSGRRYPRHQRYPQFNTEIAKRSQISVGESSYTSPHIFKRLCTPFSGVCVSKIMSPFARKRSGTRVTRPSNFFTKRSHYRAGGQDVGTGFYQTNPFRVLVFFVSLWFNRNLPNEPTDRCGQKETGHGWNAG